MIYENRVGGITVSKGKSFDYPPHIHHNIEMVICTDGFITVTCNGRTELLHRGDVMIAFPNEIHSYTQTEAGTFVLVFFDENILLSGRNRSGNMQYENFLLEKREDLVLIAEMLHEESAGDRSYDILGGYINVLWGMLVKRLPFSQQNHREESGILLEALNYISAHYTSSLSLKHLAETIGVDPCHLSRVFSQKIPGGFLRYVQELRIEHAKKLLLRTSETIGNVSLESGFSDLRTFNRVFRLHTGMTPGEFRRRYGNFSY